MKKTLIALALTSLPVAAMAEVVLYGQIKGGYEFSSASTDTVSGIYVNGLSDYGSRIGFKGKEDLGNGVNAIWQVESNVRLGAAGRGSVSAVGGTTGTGVTGAGALIGVTTVNGSSNTANALATRDSFVGLEGGFGKIRAGLLSNFQNSDMGDVNAWESGNPALGLNKFTRMDTRRIGVRYDSPEFGGLKFSAMYAPSDNVTGLAASTGTPVTTRAANSRRDVFNLGLAYQNSGFFAKYAYEYLANYARDAGPVVAGQIHRVEAGYDANNLFVGAGFQNARNVDSYSAARSVVNSNATTSGNEIALTAGYRFGNVFPKISYAHGWNVKTRDLTTGVDNVTVNNSSYDQIVVGADYDFSKRTTAMVHAGWLREGLGVTGAVSNGNQRTTAFGVGLRHKF